MNRFKFSKCPLLGKCKHETKLTYTYKRRERDRKRARPKHIKIKAEIKNEKDEMNRRN